MNVSPTSILPTTKLTNRKMAGMFIQIPTTKLTFINMSFIANADVYGRMRVPKGIQKKVHLLLPHYYISILDVP